MPGVPSEDRTRSVLDPIHGLIRLTEAEMRVVDHPLFRRLRHIKQNGLLYFVFPAATHTRFEHSLGALYVAHGMLNSLALNSRVGLSKRNVKPIAEASPGEAIAFPGADSPEQRFVYRVARLAALTHDVGHGPLSHTFDSFAPERSALEIVLKDQRLTAIQPLQSVVLDWGKDPKRPKGHVKNRRVPHEVMSCIFFTKIWNDIDGAPDIAAAVCASILGHQNGQSAGNLLLDESARSWIPLIHDVVASAPADADRMDYMERNSRAIGVTYGLFDRNRVLKSLLAYRDGTSSKPQYRLGVKRSGLQAIENLMQARYELFAQIYYHKTNRAISLMLEEISKLADQETKVFRTTDLDAWCETYLALSDESFLRMLLGKDTSIRTVGAEIQELAERIQERNLWKRILEPTTEEEADAILTELRGAFPDEEDEIRKDETKPKALKDLDKGAALLLRNDRCVYVAGKLGPWKEESTIIRGLDEADAKAVRIYFSGVDRSVASSVRERALQLVFRSKEATRATS